MGCVCLYEENGAMLLVGILSQENKKTRINKFNYKSWLIPWGQRVLI